MDPGKLRRHRRNHLPPRVGQHRARPLNRLDEGLGQGYARDLRDERRPLRYGRKGAAARINAEGVARVPSHQHVIGRFHIGHGPGHRALGDHEPVGHGLLRRHQREGPGDTSWGGLNGRYPAAKGRIPKRPANVIPEAQGGHARGQRGPLPATATADGHCGVPGIEGPPVQGVIRINTQPHFGQVRARQGNGPSGLHALHRRAINRGDGILQGRQALGGRATYAIDVFLDGKGHAMERAPGLGAIRGVGGGQR